MIDVDEEIEKKLNSYIEFIITPHPLDDRQFQYLDNKRQAKNEVILLIKALLRRQAEDVFSAIELLCQQDVDVDEANSRSLRDVINKLRKTYVGGE